MAKQAAIAPEVYKPIDENESESTIFVWATKLPARGLTYDERGRSRPDPEFGKQKNVPLVSSIIWNGGIDPFTNKERPRGRYPTRYYNGCMSLFQDSQPQDREEIEILMNGTQTIFFLHGYLEVPTYDRMLLLYLNEYCSWNVDNPNRNPKAGGLFRKLDMAKIAEEEIENLDLVEEALLLAKNATAKHMKLHARFLEIPEYDLKSNAKYTDAAIRAKYRKVAMEHPKHFIETYSDKSVIIKLWIEDALNSGTINTIIVPNRAVWKQKGAVICDISGLTTREGILNKLIEF